MAKGRAKYSPPIVMPSDRKFELPPQDWCEDNCLAGRFIKDGKRCTCLSDSYGPCKNPAREESKIDKA